MRIKSTILIVFSVISLFLLAGCQCDIGNGEDTGESPFIGGTDGLRMRFLPFSPPEEITDTGDINFKAILVLSNWGEDEVKKEEVIVSLVGFLPSEFGIPEDEEYKLYNKNPDSDLVEREKSTEDDPVREEHVVFPSATDNFNFAGDVIGDTSYPFIAKVCYKYQTTAQSRICILNNLIAPDYSSICDPRGDKQVFSSSSPVTVSGFRQSVVGENQIQFSFDIEHVGNGWVFEDSTEDGHPYCPVDDSSVRYLKINKVNVTVDTGLKNYLRCESAENRYTDGPVSLTVNLVNGKRTVTCVQSLDMNRQYETNQVVELFLDFNYFDENTVQNVKVKDMGVVTTTTEP